MSTSNETSAVTPSGSSSGSPEAQAAAGMPSGNPEEIMSTSVHSLAELREKAPGVWHAMLLGIAIRICNRMKRQQDHLKEMWREAEKH